MSVKSFYNSVGIPATHITKAEKIKKKKEQISDTHPHTCRISNVAGCSLFSGLTNNMMRYDICANTLYMCLRKYN